uniref:Uncharacterized protein n=1 Tax=Vespula pensylvanica TaxID=30213 RepID=A0A834K2N8_VESPE|nr:hypothetical protein H0235_016104 [Vespula pensylvanica]
MLEVRREEASRNQVISWFHASRLTFVVQVYPSGDFLVTSRHTYPPTNYTDTVQVLASSLGKYLRETTSKLGRILEGSFLVGSLDKPQTTIPK